jgi:glycosyltransferase involved in cell wall biosynthesis
MPLRRIAVVVQRYGPQVLGGAEALGRTAAEMLARHYAVDVLTTCAEDYMTWRNKYPAGVTEENGVCVHRFPVDFERHASFHEALGEITGGLPLSDYENSKALMRAAIRTASAEQQLECLRLQGPYSTPLFSYLRAHQGDYGLVIFFTYLYATTYWGMQQVPAAKTVLAPTAHDEALIFLPLFRDMFARFGAYLFLTVEERCFIEEQFAVEHALKATMGMPVALSATPDAARFRQKFGIADPFLLYAGRLDPSKGCDDLITYFRAARRQLPPRTKLVLIGGQSAMKAPADRDILYLGKLSEQDKLDAMAAASVFVNPSPFESFSIVVIESMLCGTPVMVNGRCDVLKGHVMRSRAGLYYETPYEFIEGLRLLMGDDALRARMGRNGAAYTAENYSPALVERRYLAFLGEAQARAERQMR